MKDQFNVPVQLRARRRFYVVGAVTIVLGSVAFWWFSVRPILPFVGKWRVERPPPTVPNLFNEVEFTFYGAVIQRVRDSTTGAVLYEESMPETQWRVSEGRFQQVANGNLLVRWLKGIRGPTLHWDHALSW
jgi:hypothetical protein